MFFFFQYDQYKTPMENIGLQDSLLSRFDLLFIMLDQMDPEQDREISDHVLRMHRYRGVGEQDGDGKEACVQFFPVTSKVAFIVAVLLSLFIAQDAKLWCIVVYVVLTPGAHISRSALQHGKLRLDFSCTCKMSAVRMDYHRYPVLLVVIAGRGTENGLNGSSSRL